MASICLGLNVLTTQIKFNHNMDKSSFTQQSERWNYLAISKL